MFDGNGGTTFEWQIESDQLREHVVGSWADQVSDREEVNKIIITVLILSSTLFC